MCTWVQCTATTAHAVNPLITSGYVVHRLQETIYLHDT
jgi:hypothetical protein